MESKDYDNTLAQEAESEHSGSGDDSDTDQVSGTRNNFLCKIPGETTTMTVQTHNIEWLGEINL